ncbi:hypothetical protein EJB05_50486, partial [Eragrostis curvula]
MVLIWKSTFSVHYFWTPAVDFLKDISLAFSTTSLPVELSDVQHTQETRVREPQEEDQDMKTLSSSTSFEAILLKFAKDRFVERQPRTTAQSTGLIMVDLVKYYAVFPVLPAFMEWGRKGYFQTQVIEGAAKPPPYLAVLAADRDQPRRPKLACAFPDIYCSNRRALLPEYSLPTKQIDHRSSLVRDLPVAVAAALHLDAPSACPGNHRLSMPSNHLAKPSSLVVVVFWLERSPLFWSAMPDEELMRDYPPLYGRGPLTVRPRLARDMGGTNHEVRMEAHLGPNPRPDEYRHVHYTLAAVARQLHGLPPYPPEEEFWGRLHALPPALRRMMEWLDQLITTHLTPMSQANGCPRGAPWSDANRPRDPPSLQVARTRSPPSALGMVVANAVVPRERGRSGLPCRIEAYLGLEPCVFECRRVFYELANILVQLEGWGHLSPESDFWRHGVPLPHGLRNAVDQFELELARRLPSATWAGPPMAEAMRRDPAVSPPCLAAAEGWPGARAPHSDTCADSDSDSDLLDECFSFGGYDPARECCMVDSAEGHVEDLGD